ncbi:unnamed protein product [Trifolium pratense]|uniref:Uncharacterized protein n=1 Tax=Trifolium pratense TaxID=57577 RepID=A0ACB0L8E6_TRIPR|nr:unnamed protein product [Trifolium pratense]
MSALSPPTHSPLLLNTKTNLSLSSSSSPSSLFLPLLTFTSKRSSLLTLFSSNKSENGLASEEKKILLEKYGYDVDADDSFSQSSPKSKRKKDQQKTRGGKQVQDPPVEPKQPPRTTHKLLQVIGGTVRRTKLLSPNSMDVRPMMEVVKGAAFDILQAAGGSPATLRPGRWLDLYSGTGSVGIEALSRGCSEVHFVEMDPWVVSDVLRPNLEVTGFVDESVIHTVRVEKFFERAEQFVGNSGAFDYISVTPPYEVVDYAVLMRLISESPFLGEDTFMVVEYPLKTDMLESCGDLVKITDRRFGRTLLAIYGPTWAQKKKKSNTHKTQQVK